MCNKIVTILLNKGRIYVDIYEELYYFTETTYSMELKLYKKDILKFLRNPRNNFKYGKSYGNCILNDDMNAIIEFLKKQLGTKKYKTISRCLIYSKKDKLRDNLNLFSTEKLYEYFIKERRTKC